MYTTLVILLSLIASVYQLEITASYKTSFQCSDGSYALISGDTLTLEYKYGHNSSELQSFHLYEVVTGRHMFDYERLAGQAFMKDNDNRLKSYEWTDSGIKFIIPDIDKKKDLGKYQGDVETEQEHKQNITEVKEIFDPPAEVNISVPSGVEIIHLNKGFSEYVFNISAESNTDITCSSLKIKWVSQTHGDIQVCQAEDEQNKTDCPLTLKESEMIAGNCKVLDVYAEHYGVQSEMKTYSICYFANGGNANVSFRVVIGVLVLVIIIAIIAIVYTQYRGRRQSKKGQYESASQCDDSNASVKQCRSEMTEIETNRFREYIAQLMAEKSELMAEKNELEREKAKAEQLTKEKTETLTAELNQIKMAIAAQHTCLYSEESSGYNSVFDESDEGSGKYPAMVHKRRN